MKRFEAHQFYNNNNEDRSFETAEWEEIILLSIN
jgi:hypothetical protein